jgi:tRNA threonylcarbamoyl adenosine modification protein (Sua5/YciO/YrdC/YwlC family)
MFKNKRRFQRSMIVTRAEFWQRKVKFFKQIKEGAIFIYPTDTVYGIGCDATNGKAVQRVRQLKNKNVMPLSVVAPNKQWIEDNCEYQQEWLDKLPGPYTLIMKLKNHACVCPGVTVGRDTIGVRIPAHWISDVAEALDRPIITTTANVTAGNVMQKLEDLPASLLHVDFIVYEGEHRGCPSELVDLTEKNAKIIKREA